MSLSSLRGSNSRLKSYDFTGFASAIDAKVDYESRISAGWDNVRNLSNMAEATGDSGDLAAVDQAKREVINLTRNWIDYVKQCDRHFGESYGMAFFSVVATIITSVTDTPDELILLKKSAMKFRDGRETDSGRVFGSMQFDSISHYLRFVDLCIENEDALLTIPAYTSFFNKASKKEA